MLGHLWNNIYAYLYRMLERIREFLERFKLFRSKAQDCSVDHSKELRDLLFKQTGVSFQYIDLSEPHGSLILNIIRALSCVKDVVDDNKSLTLYIFLKLYVESGSETLQSLWDIILFFKDHYQSVFNWHTIFSILDRPKAELRTLKGFLDSKDPKHWETPQQLSKFLEECLSSKWAPDIVQVTVFIDARIRLILSYKDSLTVWNARKVLIELDKQKEILYALSPLLKLIPEEQIELWKRISKYPNIESLSKLLVSLQSNMSSQFKGLSSEAAEGIVKNFTKITDILIDNPEMLTLVQRFNERGSAKLGIEDVEICLKLEALSREQYTNLYETLKKQPQEEIRNQSFTQIIADIAPEIFSMSVLDGIEVAQDNIKGSDDTEVTAVSPQPWYDNAWRFFYNWWWPDAASEGSEEYEADQISGAARLSSNSLSDI